MEETRLFRGGVGMPRNHGVIPFFDGFRRMLLSIFLHPGENCLVVVELVGDFFEFFSVDFEKREQMFVEPDGFVVVTVEQPFAVQSRLVNQTRQVDVTAEFLVRTAWMQSSHEADRCYVAGNGPATAS